MKDRVVVLFGMTGSCPEMSVLFRTWKALAATEEPGFSAMLVLDKTMDNRGIVDRLPSGTRRFVVWRDSSKHRAWIKTADLLAVSESVDSVKLSGETSPLAVPILMIPEEDSTPHFELAGTYADNCLFRYVARNEREFWNLTLAIGLRRYQVLQLDGLYSNREKSFHDAISVLRENLIFAARHSISFLGFSLTHIGGTPVATHGLAEGLLEAGWMVRYVCVRMSAMIGVPPGIPVVAMEDNLHEATKGTKLARRLFSSRFFRSYLRYDKGGCANMCGILLKRHLRKIQTRYVVSTRESLHFFLNGLRNRTVRRKIYFFHTQSALLVENLGKAAKRLRKIHWGKPVFVTESNRNALEKSIGLDTYSEHLVLGNCLDSTRMTARDDIAWTPPQNKVSVCWLTRIEESRSEAFDNLFEFAAYLKSIGEQSITLSVYGRGSYLQSFLDRIDEQKLGDIVFYKGATANPKDAYLMHDAVVDFSRVQSFGMVYIEAVLNGRPVFCYENEGSLEVLRDLKESFFASNEELAAKLHAVAKIGKETIVRNYDTVSARFSREVLARKFIEYIER